MTHPYKFSPTAQWYVSASSDYRQCVTSVCVCALDGGGVFTMRSRECLAGRQSCKAPGFHMENTRTLRAMGKTHKDTNTHVRTQTHTHTHTHTQTDKPREKTNIRHESFWYTPWTETSRHTGIHVQSALNLKGRSRGSLPGSLCFSSAFILMSTSPSLSLSPSFSPSLCLSPAPHQKECCSFFFCSSALMRLNHAFVCVCVCVWCVCVHKKGFSCVTNLISIIIQDSNPPWLITTASYSKMDIGESSTTNFTVRARRHASGSV